MNLAATDNDEQLLLDPWVVCTCRGWRPVKGKGEMMTYYVDLTDDLFLVEKRRHGDEEDEEEQQWEEQRVDEKWEKAEAGFAWPKVGNRQESDLEEARAGSGSSRVRSGSLRRTVKRRRRWGRRRGESHSHLAQ